MGRMSHRNQERTERRISAAASLMLCALTVLAQIAVTLLLTRFLKEKASFVYGFLQLIGAVVAIRVYQRSGSPSYKLSWMCLLLILPVAGMLLFCLWGGTHQAKQLSLKPVPPIPQRESAKMLSDLNQTALTRRSPAWGRLAAYLQKRQFWLYRTIRTPPISVRGSPSSGIWWSICGRRRPISSWSTIFWRRGLSGTRSSPY